MVKDFIIWATVILIAAGSIFYAISSFAQLSFALSSNTVTANAVVPGNCFISSASTLSINGLLPYTSPGATVAFTVNDPGGNVPANILVASGPATFNTIAPTNTLSMSNVVWATTSGGTPTPLTLLLVNTLIIIPAPSIATPTTNNIVYFGVTVPAAQPAGNYLGNVIFQNSCPGYSSSANDVVSTTVNIIGTCYITLSTNTIIFGTISPGANVPTNKQITDNDVGGNAGATIYIGAGNWIAGANNFGAQNTTWAATTQSTYIGSSVPNTGISNAVNTGIVIVAPTVGTSTQGASIFFGLGIPLGTPASTYTQNILIQNSC